MSRPVFVRFPVTVGLSCFGFKKRERANAEHDTGSWFCARVARYSCSLVFVAWSPCACRVEKHHSFRVHIARLSHLVSFFLQTPGILTWLYQHLHDTRSHPNSCSLVSSLFMNFDAKSRSSPTSPTVSRFPTFQLLRAIPHDDHNFCFQHR